MARVGRFKFSLERVLSVRKTEESAARSALAAATGRLLEAEARVAGARARGARSAADVGAARAASLLDPIECLRAERVLAAAEEAIKAADALAARREKERETARSAYAEARRKLRTLEHLRERRQEEHAQARRREESKSMDDIAVGRSRSEGDGL